MICLIIDTFVKRVIDRIVLSSLYPNIIYTSSPGKKASIFVKRDSKNPVTQEKGFFYTVSVMTININI